MGPSRSRKRERGLEAGAGRLGEDTVAAGALGLVEGAVGALDQVLQRLAGAVERGADREGDVAVILAAAAADDAAPHHRLADRLAEARGVLEPGLRQDDGEF